MCHAPVYKSKVTGYMLVAIAIAGEEAMRVRYNDIMKTACQANWNIILNG